MLWLIILLVCALAFCLAVWSEMKNRDAARETSKQALKRSVDDWMVR